MLSLETERLIIRPIRESDLEDFFEYRSDPQVHKFQGSLPFTREKTEKFIQSAINGDFGESGEQTRFVVELKSEKKVIGDVVIKPESHDARIVEIGTSFSPKYGKKGFAQEASIKFITYLFEKENIHRIIAIMDIKNTAAINLVKKLNFRCEAEFKESFWDKMANKWRDEYLYAMLKKDWERNLK